MSDGLEYFTHGWKAIETFKFTFVDSDLDPGGFEWLTLGAFDLATNIYSTIAGFDHATTSGAVKLVSTISTIIGAILPAPTITVSYINAAFLATSTQFTITEGSAPPSAKVVPLVASSPNLFSVASASINATVSGTIHFAAPAHVVETFINSSWGSPDPGL